MPVKKWPPCQICGKNVTTAKGVITIYREDIHQYEKLYSEWETKHPKDKNGSRVLSSADLSELPHFVSWHWGHSKCLKDGMYEITYDRFDTTGKALSWTVHMMEKNWLSSTNWRTMVHAHYKLPDA